MHRRSRSALVVAGSAVLSLTLVQGVAAQPPYKELIREEFSETIEDFCGEEGLTVQQDGVFESKLQVNPRKRDRLAYFMENLRVSTTFTVLPAQDRQVTEVSTLLVKDLRVTDNGDGTQTILVLATGNEVVYGSDGKAIARNPGQVRYEVLIGDNGTPQDPFDDEFLAFLGFVKESTGRTDDFCQAVVPALTA